jgi:hypothetical protein
MDMAASDGQSRPLDAAASTTAIKIELGANFLWNNGSTCLAFVVVIKKKTPARMLALPGTSDRQWGINVELMKCSKTLL